MKLEQVLAGVDSLDRDSTICAKKPWGPDSDAAVVKPDENYRLPPAIEEAGYEYFLDVPTALETLEVFGTKPPTAEEKVRLLMFYAENDAFPGWVYER